jgi:hypothetical protein
MNKHMGEAMSDNILNHNMELLKAAMPYADPSAQSVLCLLVGFFEFMDCFLSFSSDSMTACHYEGGKADLEAMMNSIRPICNKKEREIVDRILGIFNAKRMFEMYNTYMSAMKAMQEFNEFSGETSANDTGTEGNAGSGFSGKAFSPDAGEPEACGFGTSDSANTGLGTDNNMMDMLKDMIPPEQMETFKNLSMLFQSMSYDDNKKTE